MIRRIIFLVGYTLRLTIFTFLSRWPGRHKRGDGVAGTPFTAGDIQAAALSESQRNALTPDEIIEMMKAGDERFRTGKMKKQDFLAQKRASASGQYPAAIVLSCIDSRAPAEIILDMGIAVARSNIQGAIAAIRRGSPILSDLENKGNAKMVGSLRP
ncbi:hypothetical protein [Paraburkholderia guartelaensis]|uniref:Carbonic anhydrase n=1 Tax=Paraburkholderia guartelaensis TaxID=2546446 RepID=A0ABU9SIP7_9BURK